MDDTELEPYLETIEARMKEVNKERFKNAVELLRMIYAEWSKEITKELVLYWMQNLRANGCRFKYAMPAARSLIASKPYGEPKFGDFMEHYRKVEHQMNPKPYNPHRTHKELTAQELPKAVSHTVQRKLLGGPDEQ